MGRKGNVHVHAWIASIALVLVVLAGCTAPDEADDGEDGNDGSMMEGNDEPFRLGALLPISGEGAAGFGEPALQAVELAVEEQNAAGGINGRDVELEVADSRFPETQEALSGFERLAGEGVQFVISPTDSDSNAAIKPRADELEVVQMSPFATRPALSEPGSYFFRVIADDSVQGPQSAQYVYETLGVNEVVVMYEETAYGGGLEETFVEAYEEMGGEVNGESILWPHDESEYQGRAQEAVGRGTDFIWIAGQAPHIANLIDAIDGEGFEGQIMASEALESDEIFDLAGDAVDGVLFSKSAPPADNPEADEFENAYEERWGEAPKVTSPFAYDAAYVAFAAFEAVGEDGPAIREWLIEEAAVPDRVTTETIQFDSSGDVTTGGYQLWEVDAEEETFTPYTG